MEWSGSLSPLAASLVSLAGGNMFSLPPRKEGLSSWAISTLHQLRNPAAPGQQVLAVCHRNCGSASPAHQARFLPSLVTHRHSHAPVDLARALNMEVWVGRKSRSFCIFLPASMEFGSVLYFYFKGF